MAIGGHIFARHVVDIDPIIHIILTQKLYSSLLAKEWLFERLGNRQAGPAQAQQKGTRNPRASVRAEEKRDAPIPPVDSAV